MISTQQAALTGIRAVLRSHFVNRPLEAEIDVVLLD